MHPRCCCGAAVAAGLKRFHRVSAPIIITFRFERTFLIAASAKPQQLIAQESLFALVYVTRIHCHEQSFHRAVPLHH